MKLIPLTKEDMNLLGTITNLVAERHSMYHDRYIRIFGDAADKGHILVEKEFENYQCFIDNGLLFEADTDKVLIEMNFLLDTLSDKVINLRQWS